jgi:hypothetical protein
MRNTGGAKAGILGSITLGGFYYTSGTGSKLQGVDKAQSSSLGTGTAALDTSFHQMNVSCDGMAISNPVFRLGGAADTTVSGSGCGISTSTTLAYLGSNRGNSELLTGDIAELIVYKRVLSAAEKLLVEAYLNAKYAL